MPDVGSDLHARCLPLDRDMGNHDAQLCLLPVAAVAAAATAATIAAAVSAAAAATSVTATVPVRDLLEDLRKLRCRHLLV